jgi:hypothetical protein
MRYSVARAPEKKKGPSGYGRPKSREETPKEGYDGQALLGDVALQNIVGDP